MKVDLLLIANDLLEHDYIEEFVNYYFDVIGIDVIHLIDDISGNGVPMSDMRCVNTHINAGRIKYYQMPERKRQQDIYNDFYQEHKNEFDWLCVFDTDEFLVLKQHNDIHELLSQDIFCDCNQVLVNWKIYFDNGHITKPNGCVVENYTDDNNAIESTFVKSIIRGGLDDIFSRIHIWGDGCCRLDENFFTPIGTRHVNGTLCNIDSYADSCMELIFADYSVAQLNHYLFKSFDEFIERKIKSNGYITVPYNYCIATLFYFPRGWFNHIPTIMWSEQKQLLLFKKYFLHK